MSKDDRKTSKSAIAGLIVSVAAPSMFFASVLAFSSLYQQLNGALENFMLILLVLPFIALPLSIAGVVVSKVKERKGFVPGLIGLILSVVEVLFVVITIVAYLTIEAKAPDHTLDSIPVHTSTAVVETSEST